MKTLHEIIRVLGEQKEVLKKKHKVKMIKIFGSYAKEEQKESSDIDLIVDFEEPPTFIEFIRFQEELEKLLGVKVDLLTEESISPFIKPYIKEVVEI
ncbi:nucleotidyltransferase family protein [Thermatribacter velox]|uniref:Nucleotidyltransferase family protein n=1 Tax=Thermatribacter velox TaxID=3039681 RepID=A0ABZ2YEH7_9BACT